MKFTQILTQILTQEVIFNIKPEHTFAAMTPLLALGAICKGVV